MLVTLGIWVTSFSHRYLRVIVRTMVVSQLLHLLKILFAHILLRGSLRVHTNPYMPTHMRIYRSDSTVIHFPATRNMHHLFSNIPHRGVYIATRPYATLAAWTATTRRARFGDVAISVQRPARRDGSRVIIL